MRQLSQESQTSAKCVSYSLFTIQITACPACRKPLPKCALCLIPLGTSSTSEQSKGLCIPRTQ